MFIRGYVDVDARKHGCGEKKRGSINDTSSFRDSYRIQTYNLLIRSQAYCDSHRIQTYNLLIRSQMLYSVELASLQIYLFYLS